MNKTKILLTLAALFVMNCLSSVSQAVPVLNENAAQSGLITIFPDHADPALFYVAPNVLSLCLDEKLVPRFSYQDLRTGGSLNGIVQMTLCARYSQADFDNAKKGILARIPKARFSALPFASSQVKFNTVLTPFIVKEFCTHPAGMVGDEETCSFRLNSVGRKVFMRQIRDRVAMTMEYEYTVGGFLRKPEGGFESRNTTFGVAVRIGGEELKAHPELFVDSNGRALEITK